MDQPNLASQTKLGFPRNFLDTLSLQQIVEYAGGQLLQGDPCLGITSITTDSRAVRPGELFLALRGENFDGHQFVAQSAAAGGVGAVVEDGFSAAMPVDFALVQVADTLLAYQQIAARYRRSLSARVIAITGSNGKTSTKDFTAAVLGRKFRVLKTEGNFNNHIGVPRTLLQASSADEIIVLELGMNHPGEIAPLAEIAQPEIGIITNIGTAHIEYMGSRAAIAQEKGMLSEALRSDGHLVLPIADEFSASIAARTPATVVTVGDAVGDFRADDVVQELAGSHFTLVAGKDRIRASLPVPGRHMVANALLAVAAGRVCGVPLDDCVAALSDVQLTRGRMELITLHGLQILDDSYNANPDSMVAALETLARLPITGRRIAALGKMGELGETSEHGHRRVGKAAAHEKIDYLIGVGAEGETIVQSAREAGLTNAEAVKATKDAADLLYSLARQGDLILIKGSRSAGMERVLAALAESFASEKATGEPAQVGMLSNMP